MDTSVPLSGKDWLERRRTVLKRDDMICQYCGSPGFVVDHIIPKSRGGSDDESNLVTSCRTCNSIAAAGLFSCFEEKKEYILAKREERNIQNEVLPMMDEMFDPRDTLQRLVGPVERLRLGQLTRILKRLGRRLARNIDRKNPFSVCYLQNILSGRQEVGRRGLLIHALYQVWEGLENPCEQPILHSTISINALAIPGKVEPGSVVLAASIRCAYPPCNISFVPRTPSQKYCCTDHRWANRRRK